MEKYRILFSEEAMEDIKSITWYINEISESKELAKKYHEELVSDILGLELMPNRFELVKVKFIEQNNIRKLVHKNYLVFYYVNDDEKTVNVVSVINGLRDWKE